MKAPPDQVGGFVLNILGKFEPENFCLQSLNSGHLFLELSSKISWEDFPAFAEELLRVFSGSVLKRTDAVDMRIWEVAIDGEKLRIVFEDFPVMTSIESDTDAGDFLLQKIKQKLSSK